VVWCTMCQQLEKASHSKGLHPMQPLFTPAAQLLWDAIPPHFQERLLRNVSCPHCDDMTTMTDGTGGSTREECGRAGDVCDLLREGSTSAGRSPCE